MPKGVERQKKLVRRDFSHGELGSDLTRYLKSFSSLRSESQRKPELCNSISPGRDG